MVKNYFKLSVLIFTIVFAIFSLLITFNLCLFKSKSENMLEKKYNDLIQLMQLFTKLKETINVSDIEKIKDFSILDNVNNLDALGLD